ncbi:HAMP domain-containing protein [Dyella sp.]|uniref:HAMP domain-containing protein n=1 Tax=Dyella sp. TaxID=1869338 RepID=UPI0039C8B67B
MVEASLFVFFIIIIGWRTARSVSRPIEVMRKAANRIAKGDLPARIPAPCSSHRNEFGVQSRDINTMAERIESLVCDERTILQDLSHEPRSRLARLLTSLHLARRQQDTDAELGHLPSAEQEVIRTDRISSEMLALSRLEADLPGMEREWVNLVSLTQARLRPQASRLGKVHPHTVAPYRHTARMRKRDIAGAGNRQPDQQCHQVQRCRRQDRNHRL